MSPYLESGHRERDCVLECTSGFKHVQRKLLLRCSYSVNTNKTESTPVFIVSVRENNVSLASRSCAELHLTRHEGIDRRMSLLRLINTYYWYANNDCKREEKQKHAVPARSSTVAQLVWVAIVQPPRRPRAIARGPHAHAEISTPVNKYRT
jgi:hypothetical protein